MKNKNAALPVDFLSAYIIIVIFFATLIRSTFGFGESLIAVPLLALFIPLETAVPLSVLMSASVAGIVVIQDWRKIHFRSAGWLICFTFTGIPLGIGLLTYGDENWVKAGLGMVITAFSIYSLLNRKKTILHRDNMLWLSACGFLAGIFGGAYGLNGPPLAVYGAMRRWSPQHFRATLQGYFLPASLLALIGFWLKGLWVPVVSHDYLISLPAMLPAIFLGRTLNHKLKGQKFFKYVYTGLAILGLILLLQAVSGKT